VVGGGGGAAPPPLGVGGGGGGGRPGFGGGGGGGGGGGVRTYTEGFVVNSAVVNGEVQEFACLTVVGRSSEASRRNRVAVHCCVTAMDRRHSI